MKKNLLLCVCGSIAAYKACDIINRLKSDFEITVAITNSAAEIISPITLQTLSENQVYTGLFNKETNDVDHIKLVQNADLILVAPITANMIAKFNYAIADDLVSTMLVVGYDKDIIIAPAMNTKMYENPRTKRNLTELKNTGVKVIEPRVSKLACGDVALGALATVEDITKIVKTYA